jgi:uncharacterized membrane-anchored protein YitT (DUF2179 family)
MRNILHWLGELLAISIGCAITAFATNEFIIPSHLLSGGLTGICIMIFHFTHWPVGTQYLLYNIPLLILGYMYIGKKFSVYTIYAVVILSLFLNFIKIHHFFTKDMLLNAIFGGSLASLGSAIVLRMGGSTGGLDILSRIIAKYRNVTMGKFSLVVNGCIVTASAYLFQVQTAMYTLISIFTGAKTYETLLHHVDRATAVIVTTKGEEVAKAITQSMRRGVTKWPASGAYTHGDKEVLLCVIVYVQLSDLQHIVIDEDPDAFITIIPTQRVIGRFASVW